MDNIDKIFVLSKHHRDFLPDIPDDKFFITSNGLNLEDVSKVKRVQSRLVYGSSYDRGLEHLLRMWPDIKKAIPDATLNIFYGWDTFDKMYWNNPERQAWKLKMDKMMGQEGITHLGRINHAEVAQQMAQSDVWAYPTHFDEISCITAMKAQTYGAIPVYINKAALKETCQYGLAIEGDIYDDETKEVYKQRLIDLLQSIKTRVDIRQAMQVDFTWKKVAKEWSKIL